MVRFATIAPLFLLSGGTALLYQVAFGKRLALVFGATAYAVSAVLAAFMGGLALGAYVGGRYAHRLRRPLVGYGIAEIVVGAVCALSPLLFAGIGRAYVAVVRALPESLTIVSAVRMLVTALVVLVPTVAMGVTLPWLARVVAGRHSTAGDGHPTGRPSPTRGGAGQDVGERERSGADASSRRRLALLYAVNTAGGAAGALLSAYLVLPQLGVDRTMWAAALVNLAIGLVALGLGWRHRLPSSGVDRVVEAGPEPSVGRCADEPGGRAEGGLLVGLAFASGLLVFATEVVDTHLLALLIGNSAYAFGLMLAVFLTCLAAGAAAAERLERRFPRHALPVALLATAATLLLTVPGWDQLPRVFVAVGPHVHSWAGRELVRAAVALVVLLVPTVCMGLTFPLLLRRVAGRSDVARQVGRLTAVNTLGSILGALGCGYLLLPWAGSEWTLRGVAVTFASCGLIAAWVLRPPQRSAGAGRPTPRKALGVWCGCAALTLLTPGWDLRLMTNGANVYFQSAPPPDELVFVREDVHGGWTSVAKRGAVHTLYTNGKFQGDDGAELVAQRSFAHFPALFVQRFGRALVIGLGTGTTLGTIASYPFERIDVAETSPAIVEAAQRYFGPSNRESLSDPRVRLKLNDGRNVLLLSSEPYDLVTIELSSVWFAGSANLYSAEFYELCRQRLVDGGVLQQWVQLHHIRRQELGVVLRTVRQAFDHVALFVAGRQGIVVASNRPLVASRSKLAALSRRPAIRQTLPWEADADGGLQTLVRALLLSGEELDRFIRESASPAGAVVSTDENLYLEYATPKGNVMRYDTSLARTMAHLESYRTPEPERRHLEP